MKKLLLLFAIVLLATTAHGSKVVVPSNSVEVGGGNIVVDDVTGGKIEIIDPTTGGSAELDDSTNSIQVIEYEHHEIHSGSHYFLKDVATFSGGAGETQYQMFLTPDSTKQIHAKALLDSSLEYDVYIFKDPTITDVGTDASAFIQNNYQDSTNTADLIVYASPTISDDGTQVWHGKTGSGREAGVSNALGYEIIAERNTYYLFKIVKVPTQIGWIDTNFFWYEHTPKN